MDTTTSPPRASSIRSHRQLQYVAAGLAGTIAVLYGLLFAGVLTIAGATHSERGILGVAAAVFAVLAGSLWWRRSRLLWVAAAGVQLLLGSMYLAIAPDRDPAFEIWGVTIRLASLVLLVVLIRMLLVERRQRVSSRT